MRKIIFLIITIFSFFWILQTNAETLIASWRDYIYLWKTKPVGLNAPQFYGVSRDWIPYILTGTWAGSSMSNFYSTWWTIHSGNTRNYQIFNSYEWSYTYMLYYYWDNNLYYLLIDNIARKYSSIKFSFSSSSSPVGYFFILDWVLYLRNNVKYDYYYLKFLWENNIVYWVMNNSSVSSTVPIWPSSENPNIPNLSQNIFIISPNNNTLTCWYNANTVNNYSWNSFYQSNHSSITLPTINWTTFNYWCSLNYDFLNNRFSVSNITSNLATSSYYSSTTWFYNNYTGKYIAGLYGSWGVTYWEYFNFPNSNWVQYYNFYWKRLWLQYYTLDKVNYKYIYQKSSSLSNIYSNDNTIFDNWVSWSWQTTVNNQFNNYNTNNNNNINNNSFSWTTNVTIPWKCSFWKKLDPIYFYDELNLWPYKYWCQVDNESYTCPYGITTPKFIYDGYFCPVQNEENNSSSWSLIIDYLSWALSSTWAISSPWSDNIGDYNDNNYQNWTWDTSSILWDIFSDFSQNPLNQLWEWISNSNLWFSISWVVSPSWSGTYTFWPWWGYIYNNWKKTWINCKIFDDSWNFLYKPSYNWMWLLSINLTNNWNWLDYLYYIPQKLFDVSVWPYNTFILFFSFFQPLDDNVNVCYFWQVINIKYQRVIYWVWNWVSNISYLPDYEPSLWSKTIFDYVAIFILFILLFISVFLILFSNDDE